jgi:hypothetical protein
MNEQEDSRLVCKVAPDSSCFPLMFGEVTGVY